MGLLTPATDYFVKCKVDGKEKHFKIPDSADLNSQSIAGIYSFGIGAYDELSMETNITILIIDYTGQKIVANKPYITKNTRALTDVSAIIVWYRRSGEMYKSSDLFGPVKESAEIVLDEITDKYVKGRFKGKLLDENNNDIVKHEITEGEFYLPLGKSTTAAGGTGDGFVQCNFGSMAMNIMEAEPTQNVIYGNYETHTDAVGNKNYTVMVEAIRHWISPNFQVIRFYVFDSKPIEAKTYTFHVAGTNGLGFFSTVRYRQAGIIETFDCYIDSQTKATVTFTKVGKNKGEYIEGSFSITNFTGISTNKINLTGGKFKVKLK